MLCRYVERPDWSLSVPGLLFPSCALTLGKVFFRSLQTPGERETSSFSVSFYEIFACLFTLSAASSSRSVCSTKAALWLLTVASLLQFWTPTHISCSANCLTLWHFAFASSWVKSSPCTCSLGASIECNSDPSLTLFFLFLFLACSGAMHECDAVGDADGEAEGGVQRTGETLLPGWAPLLHSLEALTQEWEGQEWVWTQMHATPAEIEHPSSHAFQNRWQIKQMKNHV